MLAFILIFAADPLLAQDAVPHHNTVPDFNLTDQNGKEIKLADLKGKVWVADFIFTRCQGRCPLLSWQMAAFQEEFTPSNIKLVSFSVDPEYDTPQVLSEYAARFKAQDGKWFFLTGPKTAVWNLIIDGFSLGVDQATPEDLAQGAESVMHSSRFVLVGKEGNIQGYYDGTDSAQVQALINNALELASR
ncbi:MAG: hypothetical protein A3C35_05205 [Omnitrophica bacterium RIFCSPHIGHO2_02_FULL_46_11]|nr:MAG: hypothetical protein A3C35_05205 [Omnitrophica bacterium RIFCSPHIGHO2_02_FULL_46_11]OGW86246.1 MAG: hypothetical protein A3A81_00840 [Omnitrophica bacterium RIFCSPLOWO2_01_FULL_45_10b]